MTTDGRENRKLHTATFLVYLVLVVLRHTETKH